MLPKDYECEGQMNIWDFLEVKEKVQEVEAQPDDSICEGCKWRNHEGRKLEVEEHDFTWVYCCPGTACMNWPHGTPLNLSSCHDDFREYGMDPEDELYCFNRDFLPPLETVAKYITDSFGFHFTTYEFKHWDNSATNKTVYKCVFKKGSILELTESTYVDSDKRFIGVDWQGRKTGISSPCDNLYEVEKKVEQAWQKHLEEREALKNHKEEEEDI